MSVRTEEQELKHNPRRSVRCVEADGRRVVIKRWHSRGRWQRLLDRARARREFALLEALLERGIRVPRPLALHLDGAQPELVREWVGEARTVAELLAGPAREPERGALAVALGRWLARAHELGLHHRDLHAANVLVDAQAAVWLVDAGGARLGRPLTRAERAAALAAACGELRERSSPRWRARALRAWLEALGEAPDSGAARALEARGQELRRESVRHGCRRWLRDSSSCRRFELPQARGLCRKELAPAELEALLGGASLVHGDWRAVRGGPIASARAARERWLSAVRLADHGLPSARPLLWRQEPAPALWFALPAEARPAGNDEVLAELEPALADRGLALARRAGLRAWRAPDGRGWVSGVEQVLDRPGRAPWR